MDSAASIHRTNYLFLNKLDWNDFELFQVLGFLPTDPLLAERYPTLPTLFNLFRAFSIFCHLDWDFSRLDFCPKKSDFFFLLKEWPKELWPFFNEKDLKKYRIPQVSLFLFTFKRPQPAWRRTTACTLIRLIYIGEMERDERKKDMQKTLDTRGQDRKTRML